VNIVSPPVELRMPLVPPRDYSYIHAVSECEILNKIHLLICRVAGPGQPLAQREYIYDFVISFEIISVSFERSMRFRGLSNHRFTRTMTVLQNILK
jgi:hypothetical protein